MKLLMMMVIAGLAIGCGERSEISSHSNDLVVNAGAINTAVIVGVRANLDGVKYDQRNMKAFLESAEYFNNFKTFGAIDRAVEQRGEILELTRQAAAAASPDGTLLWYFSGHGANGFLTGIDDDFAPVMKAIRDGRNGVPLRRLVVFIDSCDSGSFITQNNASISNVSGLGTGSAVTLTRSLQEPDLEENIRSINKSVTDGFNTYSRAPDGTRSVEQLFVFTSSRQDELSGDTDQGGTFTVALLSAVKKLKKENPVNATWQDLISNTVRNADGQVPVAQVVPQTLLMEKLFADGESSVPVVDEKPYILALGVGEGQAHLFVSAAKRSEKAAICKNTLAECLKTKAKDILLEANDGNNVRDVYKTLNYPVEADKPMTFLIFDAQGQVINFRSIKLTR